MRSTAPTPIPRGLPNSLGGSPDGQLRSNISAIVIDAPTHFRHAEKRSRHAFLYTWFDGILLFDSRKSLSTINAAQAADFA